MRKIYETLEFDQVKNQLMNFVSSTLGRHKVDELEMYQDKDELLYQLALTDEASRLLYGYGRLPIGGLRDNTLLYQKAKMDGIIYPRDLLSIVSSLEATAQVIEYQEKSEIDTPNFNELVSQLVSINELSKEILRCVSYDGEIYDHASSELYRIRKTIRNIETNIQLKMEQLSSLQKDNLSEAIVTQRNDRFVLPVKSSHKHQVKGIVHAESASSKTAYIEPESVVLMNNQLAEEKMKEADEIERILYELSQLVKKHLLVLIKNQEVMQMLDFMFAKGGYANHTQSNIATIIEGFDELKLYQARHPLIDPKTVVANDIIVVKPHHMLLITGSNTGGKTVTLKTMGLLTMMSLSGLAIPVTRASIPFFDAIYCDLGDEQSIEQSLSTFSSHMKKIVEITNNVTSQSLVLIDEVGSGTDPKEGESLAQAILEFLHGYHCMIVASTHYSALKKYAKEKEYVLTCSVEFNLESMRPTYHLLPGSVGQSYAFEISSRLGLNEHIVANARELKQLSLTQEEVLLEKLEAELEANRQLQEKLNEAIALNQKQEKQWQHQIKQLENKKEELLEEAKAKANEIIEEAKEEVQIVLDDIKAQSKDVKPHVVIDAKHQLDGLKYIKTQEVIKNTEKHTYKLGDRVIILSVNREGEIVSLPKNNKLTVSLGGLKMQVNEDEIKYIGPAIKIKTKVNTKSLKKMSTGHYEINVIGMRYEEAMAMVDKFLDNALVHNYPHVRIVHGMGTGVLRKGVRQMLTKNKNVVSFRDGGPNEGGLGATLVYFE